MVMAAPKIVSSVLGKDDVMRQLILGADCAIEGFGSVAAAATPTAAVNVVLMAERRFIPGLHEGRDLGATSPSPAKKAPAEDCSNWKKDPGSRERPRAGAGG